MKKKALICDLDGTLYDAVDRQKAHLLSGKKDFDAFHRAAKNDKPHFWCAQLLQAMKNAGFYTVFTSGRDETYWSDTVEWIHNHLRWKSMEYELIMRTAGDYTPDDAMKRKWYEDNVSHRYEIIFAIDDRKRVVDMWRSLGITCLHCAEGDF